MRAAVDVIPGSELLARINDHARDRREVWAAYEFNRQPELVRRAILSGLPQGDLLRLKLLKRKWQIGG